MNNVTSRPLYPQERDPVPIVQEAAWTPEPVWTGAENLTTTGIRSPDRPALSELLYRLCYPGAPCIRLCVFTICSDTRWLYNRSAFFYDLYTVSPITQITIRTTSARSRYIVVSILITLWTWRPSFRFPRELRDFSLFRNVWTASGAIQFPLRWVLVLFLRWWSGRGVDLTTHIHLVPRLRISGAIPLHPLYAFMVWTVSTNQVVSMCTTRLNTRSSASCPQNVYLSRMVLAISSYYICKQRSLICVSTGYILGSLSFTSWIFMYNAD